jgi:hypothetical protein
MPSLLLTIRPFSWLLGERLAEKAARDHAPYDLWAEQGFLETTPGASVSYEYVAERLKEIFEDYHVTKVAFDRWNYSHLKPWLGKAGFSEHLLEQTFIEFGQGQIDVAGDARDGKPGLGEEDPARQSSCAQYVRCQCGNGRQGRVEPQAVEETLKLCVWSRPTGAWDRFIVRVTNWCSCLAKTTQRGSTTSNLANTGVTERTSGTIRA